MIALAILAVAAHLTVAQPATNAVCDVTQPNRNTPPAALVEKVGYNGGPAALMHGNGTIWTGLWRDGIVLVTPKQVLPDGSLRMKFFWFLAADGPLTVTGKRLDANAAALRTDIAAGFTGAGFQPSHLIFPTEGCWEITATANGSELTFVTRVAKAG